jgi:hypothetical protein
MSLKIFLMALLCATPLAASDWELIKEEAGIKVYKKSYEGSDTLAFKGEGLVEASVAKTAAVLMDVTRKLEWVHNIREARLVRQIAPFERIEYNHTHVPWPLSDRDFVFHAVGELDKAKGSVRFRLASAEEPGLPPLKGRVRAQIFDSGYLLEPRENGAKTWLTVEIHADPKGSLPKWIANLFQKKWPLRTIQGIRSQAARPDVAEQPDVLKFFKKP